uniref:(northern house mosquito) hypothetical protein n=1 Tax=Culex pipiens TaxID=7175 RepID=A0A8D8GWT2_CULPI
MYTNPFSEFVVYRRWPSNRSGTFLYLYSIWFAAENSANVGISSSCSRVSASSSSQFCPSVILSFNNIDAYLTEAAICSALGVSFLPQRRLHSEKKFSARS